MIDFAQIKENLTNDAQTFARKARATGATVLTWLKEVRLWLILGVALCLVSAAGYVAYNRAVKAEKLLAANVSALRALQERDAKVTALEVEIARLQAERADVDRRAEALSVERVRLEAELARTLARINKPYNPKRNRTLEQSRDAIRGVRW